MAQIQHLSHMCFLGCFEICVLVVCHCLNNVFLTEDNSNAPERMASVQGTPEQVQHVQKLIQEIIEQVISLNSLPFSLME